MTSMIVEESFAALIGIIFIYEAFSKIIDINRYRPARLQTNQALPPNCSCTMWNGTNLAQGNMTISVRNRFEQLEDRELKSVISSSRSVLLPKSSLPIHESILSSTLRQSLRSRCVLLLDPALRINLHLGLYPEKLQIHSFLPDDCEFRSLIDTAPSLRTTFRSVRKSAISVSSWPSSSM